jgi:hypothetical protein
MFWKPTEMKSHFMPNLKLFNTRSRTDLATYNKSTMPELHKARQLNMQVAIIPQHLKHG